LKQFDVDFLPVKHIDSSLDWMQVDAGQVLWRPEDVSDSFYIVINGRLRAISEGKEGVTIMGEYGQGDTVGELDVITSSPRRNTVHAIRDTELIRMPQTLFNAISSRLGCSLESNRGRLANKSVVKKTPTDHGAVSNPTYNGFGNI
jgi:CRP-like cAMP-binding protein